jgi:hypothetical protein
LVCPPFPHIVRLFLFPSSFPPGECVFTVYCVYTTLSWAYAFVVRTSAIARTRESVTEVVTKKKLLVCCCGHSKWTCVFPQLLVGGRESADGCRGYFSPRAVQEHPQAGDLKLRASEKITRNCGYAVLEQHFCQKMRTFKNMISDMQLRKCFRQFADLQLQTKKYVLPTSDNE